MCTQSWVSGVLKSGWILARYAPKPNKQTSSAHQDIPKQAHMHEQPNYQVCGQTTDVHVRYGVPPDTP
jgi:hypothetical protein